MLSFIFPDRTAFYVEGMEHSDATRPQKEGGDEGETRRSASRHLCSESASDDGNLSPPGTYAGDLRDTLIKRLSSSANYGHLPFDVLEDAAHDALVWILEMLHAPGKTEHTTGTRALVEDALNSIVPQNLACRHTPLDLPATALPPEIADAILAVDPAEASLEELADLLGRHSSNDSSLGPGDAHLFLPTRPIDTLSEEMEPEVRSHAPERWADALRAAALLSNLGPRERAVAQARFLDPDEPSLECIAQRLGETPQRILALERILLDKLRTQLDVAFDPVPSGMGDIQT